MDPQSTGAPLTYNEFLAFCESRSGRYEYVDGFAIAMAPPSNVHADLANALSFAFTLHLQASPCRVRSGAALSTGKNERVPDILVTCHEDDLRFGNRINRFPKLVVEILSPNIGDDLDRKVDEYQTISSIEDYLIVHSTRRTIVHYHREAAGKFVFEPIVSSGSIHLASIDYDFDIDALYREANLP
jgi:Uma2 family endonuclease